MPKLEVKAHAKLNLTLDILGRRSDGYHDLRMVMESVALHDRLTVEIGTGSALRIATNRSYLPTDRRNLAAAAALVFAEETGIDLGGVSIDIEKHIPVCAGLAGGSSDAAAVLRTLSTLTGANLPPERLAQLGERVGSDVPYCVVGGTALAEGRGEKLTELPPLPPCHFVLCKPPFPISTPELFQQADMVKLRRRPDTAGLTAALEAGDLAGVARRLYNVFEDVLPPRKAAVVADIKHSLLDYGALGASMSGSGPTVFGIFGDERTAWAAYQRLSEGHKEVFLTQTV